MTRSIRPLVAGNWKMNGLKADLAIATEVAKGYDLPMKAAVDLAICPPATLVARMAEGATGAVPPGRRSTWEMRPTCHSCTKMRPPLA